MVVPSPFFHHSPKDEGVHIPRETEELQAPFSSSQDERHGLEDVAVPP